jgi:predicted O-methyltransferase YrrM
MSEDKLKAAKKLLRANGYQFHKNKIWTHDPDFMAVRSRVKELKISGIPDERAFFLFEVARKLTVQGNIVECGVRHGKSTYYIASGAPDRTIHVYDSFAGLSSPTDEDGDFWRAGDCLSSLDDFTRNLADYGDRLTIHAGWLPDTLPAYPTPVAFLHLDVDLYDPTKAALECFYPSVTPGGVIVCDDYGSTLCPGAKKAFDEFFADKPERPISILTGQCIINKR